MILSRWYGQQGSDCTYLQTGCPVEIVPKIISTTVLLLKVLLATNTIVLRIVIDNPK